MLYGDMNNETKERALVEFMTKYPNASDVIESHVKNGGRIADALNAVEGGEYVFDTNGRLWELVELHGLDDMRDIGGPEFETATENAIQAHQDMGGSNYVDWLGLVNEMEYNNIAFDDDGNAVYL